MIICHKRFNDFLTLRNLISVDLARGRETRVDKSKGSRSSRYPTPVLDYLSGECHAVELAASADQSTGWPLHDTLVHCCGKVDDGSAGCAMFVLALDSGKLNIQITLLVAALGIAAKHPMHTLPTGIVALAKSGVSADDMGDFVGDSVDHHHQVLCEDVIIEAHGAGTLCPASVTTFLEEADARSRAGSERGEQRTGEGKGLVNFVADQGLDAHGMKAFWGGVEAIIGRLYLIAIG
jgi:hypothetical protein